MIFAYSSSVTAYHWHSVHRVSSKREELEMKHRNNHEFSCLDDFYDFYDNDFYVQSFNKCHSLITAGIEITTCKTSRQHAENMNDQKTHVCHEGNMLRRLHAHP